MHLVTDPNSFNFIDLSRMYYFILMCVSLIRNAAPTPCPQSRDTMDSVLSCPRNEVEWKLRAEEKQCSRVQQQCPKAGKSVYHCVLNNFVNETLEVCAPEARIIGSSCVEYNVRGAIIQESSYKCNGSCPFSYTSTSVYKYHECFRNVERKTSDLKNSSSTTSGCTEKCEYNTKTTWQIVAVVMIFMNVAFTIIILWTISSKRKLEKELKEQNHDEQRQLLRTSKTFTKDDRDKGSKKQDHMGDDRIDTMLPRREDADGSPDIRNETIEPIEQEGYKQGDIEGMYVAALDIGDQYLAMALAYPDQHQGVKPLGSVERISIFLEKKGIFTPLGAEELRSSAKIESDTFAITYVHGLKLSDENLDEKPYKGILEAILRRFSYALENEKEKMKDKDIHVAKLPTYYAFIVPSYWTDGAIERLQNTILETKIIEETCISSQKIRIIKREETLSPFIQCVDARVLCLNFHVGNLVLGPEMEDAVYAILHVGTNYCDLTFRPIGNYQVPGIPQKRKEWKTCPEEKILDLMYDIFHEKVIDDWKKTI